ncbi:hypothetical protein CLV33_1214 [Jejuia pallidilutea]|uniref:Uncharacterized protein n=1 Tax=Jejuia pallidilutea TaxID=504487 RepID=A0A362X2A7_9FLAO|nr:hypothetical protein [Jejuia pallidilutea]PQV44584.1 hypothetical protein CLV33_1214 [Jejuia pallidilutea]
MKNLYKPIVKLFILILITFSFTSNFAQEQNMGFVLTSDGLAIFGESVPITSTITKSSGTIVWFQENNGNSDTTVFNITNTTGNWDQAASTGALNYELDWEGLSCELSLTEGASGIIAKLTIHISEEKHDEYIFNINSVTYQ